MDAMIVLPGIDNSHGKRTFLSKYAHAEMSPIRFQSRLSYPKIA
ncbi:hypothetical protein [Pseudomonas arsenicoxydans]|nr:hypothetical protein [Pseudomonas arsenicoxydans]